jgi:hypothetical protein
MTTGSDKSALKIEDTGVTDFVDYWGMTSRLAIGGPWCAGID